MLDLINKRFRTYKVYETTEIKHVSGNGDVHIYNHKKLIGRITAVTAPTDDNYLAVDFAFCSDKDKFSKMAGQVMAMTRLIKKYHHGEEIFIVKKQSGVSGILKELIVKEFGNKIFWLKNIKVGDIV